MMSSELGLVDAFVFGGPKSKLRSLATPYSAGRAFIYHDPVRNYSKLSDLEAREPFSRLRDSLRKLFAANLVAELLLKTAGGGGDFRHVLELSLDCLRGIETLPEARADYPLLLFIWRLLEVIGLLPEIEFCAGCSAALGGGEARHWSPSDGGFLCLRCRHGSGEATLSAGAMRWLFRASSTSFSEAISVSLDAASLAGLRKFVFGLARSAVDGPLEVLSAGVGIL
jgi:DNA repair protein RecO (recombination protein O)